MTILLLGINASWTHSCLPLYYLRNSINDLNYHVSIVEITLKQSYIEALEVIHTTQPDVLCLSVYIWNCQFIRQLLPLLRKLFPHLKIVMGGPEVTYNKQALEQYNPDFLIRGYGERAFRELAMSDFCFAEQVIIANQIPLANLPLPYLETDKSALQGKLLYYEASRGCAFGCIYCLSSREQKHDWLPVERVIADIDRLLMLSPKVIKFVDRSFNQRREWARAIWVYVIALATDIPFHFEIHPDLLQPEDIALLATAPRGRIQLEIGIQSIHPITLEAIRRKSDWKTVKTNLQLLQSQTMIPLHTDLIVGLPGETLADIIAGIDAVLMIYPDELQLGFLKILAGTEMEQTALERGYVWQENPPYQILQTDTLLFADLLHLDKLAGIINQYWNKADFPTVWKEATRLQTPHQCLEQILAIHLSMDAQLHSVERIKRFEVMALWISRMWVGEDQKLLTDSLNWDWCRKSGEAWYPAFMQSGQALEFRKEYYTEIYDWLKTEYWQQSNWNFKRFTIFSASSTLFCTTYLDGYTKAVFVSQTGDENAICIYQKRY